MIKIFQLGQIETMEHFEARINEFLTDKKVINFVFRSNSYGTFFVADFDVLKL